MKLEFPDIEKFAGLRSLDKAYEIAIDKLKILLDRDGAGNDFLGWIDLPVKMNKSELSDIQETAEIMKTLETVVVIGIGGSYLGSRAVIEALKPEFKNNNTEILFAGHNLSSDYHGELLEYLSNRKFGLIVISKSGTTTEPAVAFRFLYDLLKQKCTPSEIRERIVVITDAQKGALRKLSQEEGFKSFVIDDNIGGRFSVLSPVGLLPIAIANYDIESLIKGAFKGKQDFTRLNTDNPAIRYAGVRNLLYVGGRKLEIMVNYNSRLNYFAEWWKQLYGESEGKDKKGIFPASVSFTTDLHSLGQYIQDGERFLFETLLYVDNTKHNLIIPEWHSNHDSLNYLAGRSMEYVNRKAAQGTTKAHISGNVPNIIIEIPRINEFELGKLIYFFEIACGISAYFLGVNPFDQPGVEEYKKNMFELLGKP